MNFPSHVPLYGSVSLVELDAVEPLILPRTDAPFRAWPKFRELARRWIMFQWAIHVVRDASRCRLLIADFANAYLLTLEAALQVLATDLFPEHRRPQAALDQWLRGQRINDLVFRGLRTLRILEAHVRPSQLAPDGAEADYSIFQFGADSGRTTRWHFPPISDEDYARMSAPKIERAELEEWNQLLERKPASALMREGLYRFRDLIEPATAEATKRNSTDAPQPPRAE